MDHKFRKTNDKDVVITAFVASMSLLGVIVLAGFIVVLLIHCLFAKDSGVMGMIFVLPIVGFFLIMVKATMGLVVVIEIGLESFKDFIKNK